MLQAKAPSRRLAVVVTFVTVGVFGLLIAGLTFRLRERLRTAVLQREAEAIHAVALMELQSADRGTADIAASVSMPLLFSAVLESSRLRGVMALQLFDAAGRLQTALPDMGRFDPAERWWALDLTEPEARYRPNSALEAIFGADVEPGATPTRVPVVEIVVPLRLAVKGSAVVGSARYWLDGSSVAAEFGRLDRELLWQGGLAYLATALVVGVVLMWSHSRLTEANRRLAAQTADLARANQELDFAAKTGAIGAISAHLIHGLKNPLAGLEGFVTDPALTNDPAHGKAWQTAVDTTRRLRSMVQEVMAVLRDEADGKADYPIPLQEVLAAVQKRNRAAADHAGVRIEITGGGDGVLLARTANLAGLVLANLIANAIDASPQGGTIRLNSRPRGADLEILIEDEGQGIPALLRATLFQPVKSTKKDGGGVGLAISRQLARHAGGDLELVRSDATGTVFCLRMPLLGAKPSAA